MSRGSTHFPKRTSPFSPEGISDFREWLFCPGTAYRPFRYVFAYSQRPVRCPRSVYEPFVASRAQGGIPRLLPSGRRSACISVQSVDPNEVHASDLATWRQKLSFVNGHLLNYYYFCTDSTSPLGWVGQDILDSVLCTCRSPWTSRLHRASPQGRRKGRFLNVIF